MTRVWIPALSATLAWDDPPGEPGATSPLQNDLDLKVIGPDGKAHLPWKLDPKNPTAPDEFGTLMIFFQIADDIGFTKNTFTSPGGVPVNTKGLSTSYKLPKWLNWGQTYYVRAYAKDSLGLQGPYSNINEFKTAANPNPDLGPPDASPPDAGVPDNGGSSNQDTGGAGGDTGGSGSADGGGTGGGDETGCNCRASGDAPAAPAGLMLLLALALFLRRRR